MVHHPGIRDIHETRLGALFEGLLKENKVTGTAKILGVDWSSIYRSIRSHHLNPVVKKQLEEYLLNNGSPEGFPGDQAGPDDTAMMVEELRREVAELKQALQRKDQEWEQRERALRAAALSVVQGPPGAPPPSVPPSVRRQEYLQATRDPFYRRSQWWSRPGAGNNSAPKRATGADALPVPGIR